MRRTAFRILVPATLAALLAACGGDGQGFVARYTVGGALTGLTATGLTVQLNGGGDLSFAGNGTFDFTTDLANGARYSVTVLTQPTGQYCSVANGIGTIAAGNVVNVGVSCAATDPELLSYEGFNYIAEQSLPGRNGGIGWAGAWRLVDGNSVTDLPLPASSGTIAAGLNYRDGLNNRLITTDGAWQTSASVFFGQGRRATVSSFGAAGTTRWISFLVRQAPASAAPVSPNFNYVSGTLGTGYTFDSPAMMGDVGLYTTGGIAAVGAFYDNAATGVALSSTTWFEGAVGFVVLRIDFNASTGANDTLSLWLNPRLSDINPGTPLVSGSVENYADGINGITLSWGDSRSFVIDEVRIGTDYAAVTPFQ